jgi:uncharacterized ParB-like nuclease family protein
VRIFFEEAANEAQVLSISEVEKCSAGQVLDCSRTKIEILAPPQIVGGTKLITVKNSATNMNILPSFAVKYVTACDYNAFCGMTAVVDFFSVMQAPIVGMTKALPRKELIEKQVSELSWEIPKKPKNSVLVDIPIDVIEHGESAMPGGKLTWPTAEKTIKEYASKKTPIPPIELMGNEIGSNMPFMVYDGSHRLEAAKLKGDKTIKAYISKTDSDALEQIKNLKK